MLSQFSRLDTTQIKLHAPYRLTLKGVCHEDIGVLGQFCAEVITISAFTHTQNSPVELRGRYQ